MNANQRLVSKLLVIVLGAGLFGFALVPLYNVFCDLTGLNGKTGRIGNAEAAARYEADKSRLIRVQFLAQTNEMMPWAFEPKVREMMVHPGQAYETGYVARNLTDRDMRGQAVPSVSPTRGAKYFNKTECFCFSEQSLGAKQSKDMPLKFIVDPALPKEVTTLSLSYTFFDITKQAGEN